MEKTILKKMRIRLTSLAVIALMTLQLFAFPLVSAESPIMNFREITGSKLLGDVNNDGNIDVADVIVLSQFIASEEKRLVEINMRNADYNQDDRVDWDDVVELANDLYLDSDQMPGDVNNDQRVSITDALSLFQYLKGDYIIIKKINSDYNEDGKINKDDAYAILEYLFGENQVEEIIEDFEKDEKSEKKDDKLSFPTIIIYGYGKAKNGLEAKFNIFEKKVSERVADDLVAIERHLEGQIQFSSGETYLFIGMGSDKEFKFINQDKVEKGSKVSDGLITFDFENKRIKMDYELEKYEDISFEITEMNKEPYRENPSSFIVESFEKPAETGKVKGESQVEDNKIEEKKDNREVSSEKPKDKNPEVKIEKTEEKLGFWVRVVKWFKRFG